MRRNEDSLSLQCAEMKRREAAFLLVSDGIGGLGAGEWASGFVAERMTQWFWEKAVGVLARRGVLGIEPRENWQDTLARSAIRQLKEVQEEMEWHERSQGIRCGATCTMALVWGGRFLLLHCGDSRAYLIGKKERCLTCDHHEQGKLAKCVGDFGFQRPDVICGRIRRGEILLLCTDGYCGGAPEGFFLESLGVNGRSDGKKKWNKGEDMTALDDGLQRIGRFLLAHGEQDNLTAVALRHGGYWRE